ncbi:MAG TPA: hypothetical protein VFR85_08165 [Anaeromyxobacteraceae bacterium]|nr:hypothetical protein [Anaeromyxobacteraceae bacterium]
MTNNPFRCSGIVRAAATALALALVPALASAQTAPAKKAPKPAPAAAPAPAPDPAPAPAPEARTSSTLPYAFSFAIGPSFEGQTALKLRLEGSMAVKPLFPNSTFELVLPLNFAFWGQSYAFPPYTWDYSYFRMEIVPTVRISAPVARNVGLYGDTGLGFQYFSSSFTTTAPQGFPVSVGQASGAGGIFKLAGGGYYAFDPNWRAFVEPVGLNFYFGSASGFVYTIMFGAQYRFRG